MRDKETTKTVEEDRKKNMEIKRLAKEKHTRAYNNIIMMYSC